ncbi:hypothetical protein WA026_006700 [Henosepilachna vigintioctopunctata]|uniref:Uncharacterized protein n=1 Tax=Henosepilachna vigintioctopunctata TaxID=420089 RepID=A0AAW1UHL5_9CUCU
MQQPRKSTKVKKATNTSIQSDEDFCSILQNAQSIRNAFGKLELLVLEKTPKLLAITEHWQCDDAIRTYNLKGYKLALCFSRPQGKHGGCAIFLFRGVGLHGKDRY